MSSATPRRSGKSWREGLLPIGATVQQAIHCLNTSALQIAMVVSGEGTLIGTITDGDIRRGLLRGLDLTSSTDSIIQRQAMVVPADVERVAVMGLMQANGIHALPIVTEDRRVIGLHVLNELLAPTERSNLMVIMAGGQGTRLMPHTEGCPKPLLSVGGKPILEHILERAIAEGFQRFVITLHYLGHMIEEYFGDGRKWGASINYVRETEPLGTAGALALLVPHPTIPLLVANGDVLADIRYGELLDFHCHHGATATMAVRQYEWQHPYGVVHTRGIDITAFEEKPIARSHVNAGIYALEPRALDDLAAGEPCDMTLLFSRLQQRGDRTIVYPMHEPWLDVGLPADLARARSHLVASGIAD